MDITLLYVALLTSLVFRYSGTEDMSPALIKRHLIPFTIVFSIWLINFGAFGLYEARIMQNSKRFLYQLMRAMLTNTVLAIVIFYLLLPAFEIEPRRNLFMITMVATLFILSWRFLFNLFIIRAPVLRIMFLGITKETLELAEFLLLHPQLGYRPVAFVSLNGYGAAEVLPGISQTPSIPHYPSPENVPAIIRQEGVEMVVIMREVKENMTLVKLLFDTLPLGVGVIEFSRFYEILTGKIPLSLIGEVWFLENLVGIKKRFYEFFKRGADIVMSIIAGLPALIFLPVIAAAIKIDSPGPVFYRQKRVGRHGKEFWVLKYRTMIEGADKLGGFKGRGRDPRHTRVGIFLRKSYLDELPQIWNILKGEMSFVGPRPERPEYVAYLKERIPFYEMRLLVPPGITGWAQINMENDASVEDAPEKMQYDLYYIKNRSFILDLLIILRTIYIVLRRQGR